VDIVPDIEKRKAYNIEYIRNYQRQFMLKVNRKTEPEMVEWLESQKSVQTYLKQLILEDMNRKKKE
jgi:hypothetical protein